MPTQSDILRKCIDTAVSSAAALLERCLDQVAAALQEAENASQKVAERNDIAEAARELHKQRTTWTNRFARELRLASARAPSEASAPAPSAPPRRGTLSLVDDDALVQSIESSRLTQNLLSRVEQSLAELDALMSTVLGLPTVRPEANPLRPETFALAVRATLGEAPPGHPGWPALWGKHLAPPMGRELDALYRLLSQQLQAAKVQAATYRVLPVASPSRPAPLTPNDSGMAPLQAANAQQHTPTGGPASNDARMGGPAGWANLHAHSLGEPLLQDFLFHGRGPTEARLQQPYYQRIEEELEQLEAAPPSAPFDPREAHQYAYMPSVDRPKRHVATDSPLDGEVWGEYAAPRERDLLRTRLRKSARKVGQVLGLEVVRKLVNQVAQDPRLLAPVREAVVALEPALLKLAMVDPRFFGQEQHPARRLVERVAERSFKYNDEFSPEFEAFKQPVAEVFTGLNGREIEGPEAFTSALAGLEQDWAEHDAQEQARSEEMVDAVRFAEQRQAEADQIAWELGQRSDLENVPAVVQDFLFGPWSLVMAHARMNDTRKQIDPGGHGSVISDLLWSVKREGTLRQPGRLIEMIPGLLERLRTGLAALGQDPQESDSFFQSLEKLHRPVLKLRARLRRDSLDSAAVELAADLVAELTRDMEPDAAPGGKREPRPAGQPWMGPRELDAAGFQDTLPTDHAELVELRERTAEILEPETQEAEPQVDPQSVIAGLREGGWVDLYSKREWLRAQLIWASTKGTLFMFTSHGGQPHSMTRRSLERLVRERLLRPVDGHGVVDQAIDTLRNERPREAAHSQPQPLAA